MAHYFYKLDKWPEEYPTGWAGCALEAKLADSSDLILNLNFQIFSCHDLLKFTLRLPVTYNTERRLRLRKSEAHIRIMSTKVMHLSCRMSPSHCLTENAFRVAKPAAIRGHYASYCKTSRQCLCAAVQANVPPAILPGTTKVGILLPCFRSGAGVFACSHDRENMGVWQLEMPVQSVAVSFYLRGARHVDVRDE